MTGIDDFLNHISEKPWSDYTSADYSVEQWHKACLIHQHQGTPTSKGQCKIPVRTPNGALNRNGVHAAAAALAGARGGVNASSEEKAKALSSLRRLYGELGEKPPSSVAQSDLVGDFLQHVGVKGMKWGVRKRRSGAEIKRRAKRQKLSDKRRSLSDDDLKKAVDRIQSEKKLKELVDEDLRPGKTVAKKIMSDSGQKIARTVVAGAGLYAIKVAVERKFSPSDAVGFIAPKPKK